MSAREAIAAAASTVEGVNVVPRFRASTRPGDGCVRLDRVTYPNTLGGYVTWQVLITLAQDVVTAETWLDAHLDELVDALGDEMTVSTVEPRELVIDTGRVPCVVVTGTRETE